MLRPYQIQVRRAEAGRYVFRLAALADRLKPVLLYRRDIEVADVYEVAGYGGGCGH